MRVGGELKGGVVESLWLPREEKLALEKKKQKKPNKQKNALLQLRLRIIRLYN